MKLAVVGHSYLHRFGQAKFVALKSVEPALQLRLIVPKRVDHLLSTQYAERAPGIDQDEFVVCRSVLNGNHMAQALSPWRLGWALAKFRPDILHIEEDPYSVSGLETVLLARLLCPKAKLTFFTWDNLGRTPAFPKNLIKRWLTRLGFGRAALIVCGNRQAQLVLHERKGYSRRSVVLPQIGVSDQPELAARRVQADSSEEDGRPITIGFIGRLVPEKGLYVLRDALEQIHDRPWHLRVVGNGLLGEEIKTDWGRRFGDRMTFSPAVPHDEVAEQISKMDIFVLPSLTRSTWQEQFGLTLAMAMMLGCACVGSDSGAIPDVLGQAGRIVPEGDAPRLAEALSELIDNPAERARLGDAARQRAVGHFTHEAIARAYLNEFQQVLDAT